MLFRSLTNAASFHVPVNSLVSGLPHEPTRRQCRLYIRQCNLCCLTLPAGAQCRRHRQAQQVPRPTGWLGKGRRGCRRYPDCSGGSREVHAQNREMTNDEARMSKEARNPNDETGPLEGCSSSFDIRASLDIRASSFVIRSEQVHRDPPHGWRWYRD